MRHHERGSSEVALLFLFALGLTAYLLWQVVVLIVARAQFDFASFTTQSDVLIKHYRTQGWVERDHRGVVDGGYAEMPLVCGCVDFDERLCASQEDVYGDSSVVSDLDLPCWEPDISGVQLGDSLEVRLIDGFGFRAGYRWSYQIVPSGFVSRGDTWIGGYTLVRISAWPWIIFRFILALLPAALAMGTLCAVRQKRTNIK